MTEETAVRPRVVPSPLAWPPSRATRRRFDPPRIAFADPLKYIAAIRADAEKFGVCKILAPTHQCATTTTKTNENHPFHEWTRRRRSLLDGGGGGGGSLATIDVETFRVNAKVQTVNDLVVSETQETETLNGTEVKREVGRNTRINTTRWTVSIRRRRWRDISANRWNGGRRFAGRNWT